MRLDHGIMKTARFAAVLGLAVGLAGCGDLLEVSDPSRYTSEGLDDPLAMPAVANGVEGNLQFAIDDIVIHTGLLSDELTHTGTWTEYEDSERGRYRPGDVNRVQQATMQNILTSAKKAEERFIRVMGDSAPRTKMMAQVVAAAAWSPLIMGMTNCENVVEPNGPAISDSATISASIPLFTRAIEVAGAANQTAYANFARAGRARAYLLTGDYDKALADAQAIPKGFTFNARYSNASSSNSLVTLNHYTENKAAGLDQRRQSQVDTTRTTGGDVFLDKWSNQPDPRVQIVYRTGNRLGVDGRSRFFSQNKYKTRDDDIPITHWREMRLIEAEVYWRKGDFGTAITKMNEVRTDVGLPDLTNPGTSQGVFDRLIEERFATLFLEGQRAHDLYRFNLFPSVIGTGYSTRFPLNSGEFLNNPNVGGRSRPCPKTS
jgi:hypothetical protein